ncbi:MAG: MFS transporter [Propionibacteriaceae bacterium]|jgi:MFS family permease|nr:MFS transporter [Propionibacteriaceae bacterium]
MGRHRQWAVFILVSSLNLFIMIPYLGPAAILPTLIEDLSIPMTMTAYVVSIYLIMSGVFIFAGSLIGGRIGYHITWWMGLVAVTIGLVVSAVAPGFAVFFLGRMISGLGFGVTMSAQTPLAGMWFQGARFTALQTVTGVIACVGVASAYIVFPLFESWRVALWLFAGITLGFAAVNAVIVKPPPGYAGGTGRSGGAAAKEKPKFGFVMRNRDFMLILLINAVANSANTVLLTYMTGYFLEEARLSRGLAAGIASVLTFIQMAGAIGGGILTGKTGRRKVFIIIGTACYGVFGVGLVLFGNLIGLVVVSAVVCGMAFYFRMPAMAQYFLEETEEPDPGVMAAATAVTSGLPMLLNLVSSAMAGAMVVAWGYGGTILVWHVAALVMVVPALLLREVGPRARASRVASV